MNIMIDGIDTNYIKEGTAERSVILLHGWGSNLHVFQSAVEFLSGTYSVYAMDLPGFGHTAEPKTPWNVDDYATFVLHFAKKMGIKRASFLGHSNGGRIIVKLAACRQGDIEIDKIILVDSAGILPKKTFRQKAKTCVFKSIKWILNLAAIRRLFPNALNAWKNKLGSADYRAASEMMKKCLVKIVNEDLTPYLSKIKVPTLLIWGDKDTATPISDAIQMNKTIPDSGLVTLKNAGHYSFLEQNFVFIRVLDSFLNDRGNKS